MAQMHTQTSRSDTYSPARAEMLTPGDAIRTTLLNRVSWGAVFAGVVMAFAVQIILNLLGLGIGVATLTTTQAAATATEAEFSIAAMGWWIAAGIIAAGIGGLTAGRLAGEPKRSTAGWHGLIAWAASVLLLTSMMTTTAAGAIAGGPFQVVVDNGYIQAERADVGAESGVPTTPTDEALTETATQVGPEALSSAALISAIALIFGALAAWLGGSAGAVNPGTVRGDGRQQDYLH